MAFVSTKIKKTVTNQPENPSHWLSNYSTNRLRIITSLFSPKKAELFPQKTGKIIHSA
jgi:hypothetical protein